MNDTCNVVQSASNTKKRRLSLGLVLALSLCLSTAAVFAVSADNAASAAQKVPLGWSIHCEPLPSRQVDPIVYPGKVGLAHLHDPFGQRLDPKMTHAKLRGNRSNCRFKNGTRVDDRSAYWMPALHAKGGRKVPIRTANVYYRVKPGMNYKNIKPFPRGLKIIAGRADATGPQRQPAGYKPGNPIVEWKCFAPPGNFSNRGNLPTDCGRGQHVAVSVTFPDCAKAGVTDSADHKSHMAYSRYNRCPRSHPVHVMQANFFVVYDLNDGRGAYLSSNHQKPRKAYGMHADFFEAWGRTQIRKLIHNCVYSGNGCREAGRTGR